MDSVQWCNYQKDKKNKKKWSELNCAAAFPPSDYRCRLTFHTEFGAAAVFVDENKKDKEEDASKARQAHSNGNLRETKCCIRLRQETEEQCSNHDPFQIFLTTLNNANHSPRGKKQKLFISVQFFFFVKDP